MNEPEFLPTRPSLLSRLKNADDQQSWREFCMLYRKLIYGAASRSGLTDAEAQDVVQETFIIVARKMPEFRYDPRVGSFKSWVSLITHRRIEKQLKKRLPSAPSPSPSSDSTRTSTLHRVPAKDAFESAWNAEWEKNLWSAAVERIRARLKPKQFQMFDLYVVKEWPISEVARALGVSATHVYVNKHRVSAILRKELRRLSHQ